MYDWSGRRWQDNYTLQIASWRNSFNVPYNWLQRRRGDISKHEVSGLGPWGPGYVATNVEDIFH